MLCCCIEVAYENIVTYLLVLILFINGLSGCNKNAIVFRDNLNGNFTDGSKPYESNERCRWIIVNPDFINRPFISLQFTEKILECSYDYVVILSSDEKSTTLLATLSGNSEASPLPSINIRAKYIIIYLFSDTSYNLDGFSAVFNIYTCPNNCNRNGDCLQNRCHCFHTWSEEDCSKPLCPNSCSSPQGICLYDRSEKCTCNKTYIGNDCKMSWHGHDMSDSWIVVNNYSKSDHFSTGLVGHAGCYVEPYLWIFGGFDLNNVFNSMLRYNFSENRWSIVQAKHQPFPRYFHTMSHIHSDSHDYLLMFGGEHKNGTLINDLWIFNISNMSWEHIENTLTFPIATAQHAASVVDLENEQFVYIYGGKIEKNAETVLSSSIYRFCWSTKSWEKVAADNAVVSKAVLYRAGHSMVYDSFSSSLIVYGGYELSETNQKVQRSRKLLKFDLHRLLWIEIRSLKPDLSSNMLKPMAFHSASIVGDYMILFGGSTHKHMRLSQGDESCHDNLMYFYHLRCHIWSHESDSFKPAGRIGHVAVIAHGNVLLVHGGYNGIVLNDLLAYKVPLFANKNIPYVCSLYLQATTCDRDQRCVWSFILGCNPRNQSLLRVPDKCPGICSFLETCAACSASSSYDLDESNEWKKVPCSWCVNKVSCYSFKQSDKCNEYKDDFWWISNSTQLLNSSSQCIRDNIVTGFLAAFYLNDERWTSPYEVILFHDEFSIDQAKVTSAPGNYTVVIKGFLHLPSNSLQIRIFLQVKDGYGRFFLSNNDDPAAASLRLENPGNFSQDDTDPSFDLNRASLNGNRLYYEVTLSYILQYEGQWNGYLKLSWTMDGNSLERYTTISSDYLEPFHSPSSVELCHTYSTCLNCLLDYSCAWCSGTNKCMTKIEIFHFEAPHCYESFSDTPYNQLYFGVVLEPTLCPLCQSRQTCNVCLEDDFCGWNISAACQKRNYHGKDNEITLALNCLTPCYARTTCTDCLVNDGANECLWCFSRKRCYSSIIYPLVNTFGQCILWTRNHTDCQNCSEALTCKDCTQKLFCGWCGLNPFQGSCTYGNLSGPENMTECSTYHSNFLQESSNWVYGYCDVNECKMEWPVGRRLHNCSSNATCIDTIHSYECNCDRGFIGDGFVCEPTCYKDCVHGICQGPPQYQCECAIGWFGDQFSDALDCNFDCQCNFHSTCQSGIGACDNCQHNTIGSHCEDCLPEHYGDATMALGCQACQCNGHGNKQKGLCDSFSGACYCLNNTDGVNCERCLPGFYGNPRQGGTCFQICNGRYYVENSSRGAFGTWNIKPQNFFLDSLLCIKMISFPKNDLVVVKVDKNLNISCSDTRLMLYNGIPSSNTSNLLAAICGIDLKEDIILFSTTGLFYVSYESAFKENYGFNATFEVISCSLCSWQISLSSCVNYLDKENCLKKLCQCHANFSSLMNYPVHFLSGALSWQLHRTKLTLDQDGSNPGAVFGHSLVSKGYYLWLYGGFSYGSISSDLWKYNTITNAWSRVLVASGPAPQARYMHAAIVSGEKMLVYGGMTEIGTTLNDFWEFDFKRTVWMQLFNSERHPDVAGHTITLHSDSTLVLIGGYSTTNGFNKVWTYSLSNNQWSKISCMDGESFYGIFGHSAHYDSSADLIYVFGGISGLHKSPSNQMQTYSVTRKQWNIVFPENPSKLAMFQPHSIYFHSTASYHNGSTSGFLVIGGKQNDQYSDIVWLFSYQCNLWMRLYNDSLVGRKESFSAKIGMLSAVAAVTDKNDSSSYFVYGGNRNGVVHSSFQSFKVESLCGAAATHRECASMLAGCSVNPSKRVNQKFCICSENYNSQIEKSTNLQEFLTHQCFKCNLMLDSFRRVAIPGKYEVAKRLPNITTDFVVNARNGCLIFDASNKSCDNCISVFLQLGVYSMNEVAQYSNCTFCPRRSLCDTIAGKWSSGFKVCGLESLFRSKRCEWRTDPKNKFSNCILCDFHDAFTSSETNQMPTSLRFFSLVLNRCLSPALFYLYCSGGICGRVIKTSLDNCAITNCSTMTYCRQCLRMSRCGWMSSKKGNGDGVCLEGNVEGSNLSATRLEIQDGEWNFISCPLENECQNGHHKCNTTERLQHTVCQDIDDGYECVCEPKYEVSSDNFTCVPVCNPTCIQGYCKHPDICECNFGYRGLQCQHSCNCNGHSKCFLSTVGVETCTFCRNNTVGDRCQHCKKNYVGNPVDGGQCHPCNTICSERSSTCVWDRVPYFVGGSAADYEFGPTNADVALCINCTGHSEGRHCESCVDGYFEYRGQCHKCTCNGHDDVCDKRTGRCKCKNNTRTSSNRDCHAEDHSPEDRLACLEKQCDQCDPSYSGEPKAGGLCYYKLSEGSNECLNGFSHLECSSSSLTPGSASYFVLGSFNPNLDIKLIIDVSSGEVDVFISDNLNFFQINSDSQTGDKIVTWKDNTSITQISKLIQSSFRKKRETLWEFSDSFQVQSRTRRSAATLVKTVAFVGHSQLLSMMQSEALVVKNVNGRLIVLFSSDRYQLNATKFYVIVQARRFSVRSSVATSAGSVGKIYALQALSSINVFVFFTLIFCCFCLVLFVVIILWKLKNTVNDQQAMLAHHMQLQHMASRPFSTIYVDFSCDTPSARNRSEKSCVVSAKEKRSSETFCVCEHKIPMLNTPGDVLTVVAPENESRISPDLHPQDVFIPEPSSRKIHVIPKSSHEFSFSNKPDSWRVREVPPNHSSSTPCLTKLPTSSNAHSSCHSAPAVGSHRSKTIGKQRKYPERLLNVGPVALEMTGDFRAAIATFVLQLPAANRHPSSVSLGSSLVSTRNLTLHRSEAAGSKRKNYAITEHL